METINKDLEILIKDCPKTLKQIKKYYLKEDPKLKAFLTEDIIIISITNTPYSILDFFDNRGLIGTLSYNYDNDSFIPCIDGNFLTKNSEIFNGDNGDCFKGTRKEALVFLVSFLFKTNEKTL